MKKEKIVIQIDHLEKRLDKKQILHDVNLCVYEGEIFWFLGPNGAGKTTAMKCILQLILPDSGKIEILGYWSLSIEVRKQIGFMPENTYLYKYLTWREFLRFNGNFFDIPKSILEERIEELLVKVELQEAGDKLLTKYSKWMLQRIGLAQAIINNPKIVFLDEPMSGLDPIGRKMVKNLILELKKSGTTIFFNTHILSDVETICDRFAIIHYGSIIANEEVKFLKEPLEDYFIKKIQETPKDKLRIN